MFYLKRFLLEKKKKKKSLFLSRKLFYTSDTILPTNFFLSSHREGERKIYLYSHRYLSPWLHFWQIPDRSRHTLLATLVNRRGTRGACARSIILFRIYGGDHGRVVFPRPNPRGSGAVERRLEQQSFASFACTVLEKKLDVAERVFFSFSFPQTFASVPPPLSLPSNDEERRNFLWKGLIPSPFDKNGSINFTNSCNEINARDHREISINFWKWKWSSMNLEEEEEKNR